MKTRTVKPAPKLGKIKLSAIKKAVARAELKRAKMKENNLIASPEISNLLDSFMNDGIH
jgi:hypothetical protein